MSFQPGLGEVGLKGPYVALTPSPIIAISENGRKISKHEGGIRNVIYNSGSFAKISDFLNHRWSPWDLHGFSSIKTLYTHPSHAPFGGRTGPIT